MNYGIILAAGNGTRLELKNPIKPLVIIKSKPLFYHSLSTFLKNKQINEIVLVVNKKYRKAYLDYAHKAKLPKPVYIIDGSDSTRQASLLMAINFLKNKKRLQGSDIIVTHDAARINVSDKLINLSINTSKKHGYASTVLPLYDSLCEITTKSKYIDRAHKYLVQTPQTFQYKYWKQSKSSNHATDLFTYLGLQVSPKHLVIGYWNNYKITTKNDLVNI